MVSPSNWCKYYEIKYFECELAKIHCNKTVLKKIQFLNCIYGPILLKIVILVHNFCQVLKEHQYSALWTVQSVTFKPEICRNCDGSTLLLDVGNQQHATCNYNSFIQKMNFYMDFSVMLRGAEKLVPANTGALTIQFCKCLYGEKGILDPSKGLWGWAESSYM